MTYKDFLTACKQFATDSNTWSFCPRKYFTTTGDGTYSESCDNSSGGIDVSWCYKMTPEQVENYAPQLFMDSCTELLLLVIDGDCDTESLKNIYDLFT